MRSDAPSFSCILKKSFFITIVISFKRSKDRQREKIQYYNDSIVVFVPSGETGVNIKVLDIITIMWHCRGRANSDQAVRSCGLRFHSGGVVAGWGVPFYHLLMDAAQTGAT